MIRACSPHPFGPPSLYDDVVSHCFAVMFKYSDPLNWQLFANMALYFSGSAKILVPPASVKK